MNRDNVIIGDTPADYSEKVGKYLEEVLKRVLSTHGIVSLGVSGGSMPKLIVPLLLKMDGLNWKRIRLFMVDERFVPADDADSNYGQYVRLFPEDLKDNVVPVDLYDSLAKTASNYDMTLRGVLQPEMIGLRVPRFDILLLGMGPDGHTASLFPNSRVWKHQEATVLPVDDSPKMPPKRITLSLSAINNAKNVAFLITGEEKADVTKCVLDGDQRYPASMVKPWNGRITYFLDKGAASKL